MNHDAPDRDAVLFETIDALKRRIAELEGVCRQYARENRRLAEHNLELCFNSEQRGPGRPTNLLEENRR